ncbi:MAG: hypothetical protein ACM3WP_10840 [Acidobacteriota bacterium]
MPRSNANPSTNQVLDMLDREYCKLNEIEPQLFEFIETHQNNIQLTKGVKPPFDLKRFNRSNAAKLCTYVAFEKPPGDTVEELGEPARKTQNENQSQALKKLMPRGHCTSVVAHSAPSTQQRAKCLHIKP